MPKVSDLAKDLGYKAAELVLMVNQHNIGVTIANARADVDARTAASIPAKLPHRRDLKGATAEEKAAMRTEVEKPLIDGDKVIGQEPEVRVQHTAEAKALESGAVNVGEDKEHRAAAHRPKQTPLTAPTRGPVSPAMSRARRPMMAQRPPLRPQVPAPPRAKPVLIPIDQRKFEVTV